VQLSEHVERIPVESIRRMCIATQHGYPKNFREQIL
jgi:hypothetical protein